ncbi:type II toxin-antitoxin system RelE/ParE family toxin [Flavobacterium sp. DGU11]|uniref:Type II toxin-antitoxin system RelE/ParE family toxin n=1 Tax=Flavobacterium arundinis TaxID=3139143 RepID=A0ABU9HTQ2_9FLAO
MNKRIRLSPSAKKDFGNILEYLSENWDARTVNNFIDIFQSNLKRIAFDPKQFMYFRKDLDIRKCIVTKHNTLYFKETEIAILVIRIYDVRQKPSKLKF